MEHVFLVVFDLDGVIVNTSSFHYRAWKRLLAEEWGVEHTQEVDDMTKGIGRYECLRLITQQYGLSVPETSFRALADRKNSYYVQLLHTELGPENILPFCARHTFPRRLPRPASMHRMWCKNLGFILIIT